MINNQILASKPESPFTWASGLRSPIYCDNRILLSYPEIRTGLVDLMVKVIKDFQLFDTVAGVATAGIPAGVLLADRLKMPFAYVRAKPKEHGRQTRTVLCLCSRISRQYGSILKGQSGLEDLISTGMSSLQAVEAIRQVPAQVVGVLAIFQYGMPKATEAFEKAGCPFYTLTDFKTIIQVAAEKHIIEHDHLELLSSWSADPQGWSENYLRTH